MQHGEQTSMYFSEGGILKFLTVVLSVVAFLLAARLFYLLGKASREPIQYVGYAGDTEGPTLAQTDKAKAPRPVSPVARSGAGRMQGALQSGKQPPVNSAPGQDVRPGSVGETTQTVQPDSEPAQQSHVVGKAPLGPGAPSGGGSTGTAGKQQTVPANTQQTKAGSDELTPAGKTSAEGAEAILAQISPELSKQLELIKQAFQRHDVVTARQLIAEARPLAKNELDSRVLDQLSQLADYLEEFWRVMHQIIDSLRPLQEIPVKDTYVIVVEKTETTLTLKAAGQIRQYDLNDLPPALIVALAEQRLAKDPATQVIFGTYLAVEQQGDFARAVQLWQNAIAQGIDVAWVLPALMLFRPGAEQVGPSGNGGSTPNGVKSPARQDAEQASIADPEAWLRQQYADLFAKADNRTEARQLAEKLLSAGRDPQLPNNVRIAALKLAKQYACKSGNVQAALTAVDELAKLQRVDFYAERLDCVRQLSKTAWGVAANGQLARVAVQLATEAAGQNRLKEASELLDIAANAARESKSLGLLRQIMAAKAQLASKQRGGR